jgi:DUF1365 family protein
MNSCLYHGRVKHTRYLPRYHSFSYKLFQFFFIFGFFKLYFK